MIPTDQLAGAIYVDELLIYLSSSDFALLKREMSTPDRDRKLGCGSRRGDL